MLSKKDWFWILLALAATWGVDRWSKLEALKLIGTRDYGYMLFSLHYNPGAILGLFSQLPSVLRVVTLSTGGAFLIFTFFILQYLIPSRAMPLRIGMSLLLGGIMGNVADRIVWGHVVDFISLRYGTQLTPIFNVADAIQWIGHFMIMYSLMKNAEIFWPESNVRKTQWINLRFQIKYFLILMTVGLGMGVIAGTFSYTYLRVTLLTLTGDNHAMADRYLIPFALSLGAVNGIFLGGLYLIGKLLSLRVAGPVYAFEKFVRDLLDGNYRTFKVRSSDEFQQLTQLGMELRQHFIENDPDSASKVPGALKKAQNDSTQEEQQNEKAVNSNANDEAKEGVLPRLIFAPGRVPSQQKAAPPVDEIAKALRASPQLQKIKINPQPKAETPPPAISEVATAPALALEPPPFAPTEAPLESVEIPAVTPTEVPLELVEIPAVATTEVLLEPVQNPAVATTEVLLEPIQAREATPAEVPLEPVDVPTIALNEEPPTTPVLVEEALSPIADVKTEVPPPEPTPIIDVAAETPPTPPVIENAIPELTVASTEVVTPIAEAPVQIVPEVAPTPPAEIKNADTAADASVDEFTLSMAALKPHFDGEPVEDVPVLEPDNGPVASAIQEAPVELTSNGNAVIDIEVEVSLNEETVIDFDNFDDEKTVIGFPSPVAEQIVPQPESAINDVTVIGVMPPQQTEEPPVIEVYEVVSSESDTALHLAFNPESQELQQNDSQYSQELDLLEITVIREAAGLPPQDSKIVVGSSNKNDLTSKNEENANEAAKKDSQSA